MPPAPAADPPVPPAAAAAPDGVPIGAMFAPAGAWPEIRDFRAADTLAPRRPDHTRTPPAAVAATARPETPLTPDPARASDLQLRDRRPDHGQLRPELDQHEHRRGSHPEFLRLQHAHQALPPVVSAAGAGGRNSGAAAP